MNLRLQNLKALIIKKLLNIYENSFLLRIFVI